MRVPQYHVTMLTRRGAETWTRTVYRIPADVGLGWRPYRYLVLRDGHTSIFACYKGRELKRWLSAQGMTLRKIHRAYGRDPWAVAYGWAEPMQERA
jgi:hypothetical protein